MNFLKYILVLITILIAASDLNAQPSKAIIPNAKTPSTKQAEIHELTIGDQVPDIVFGKVLNYKTNKVKLSDFRGKLVILDMWSVYCLPCITAFSKMDSLQKEFNGEIQILLVNSHNPIYETVDKVKTIIDGFKTRNEYPLSLPIPIHDTSLNSYFPHQSVPHQIWIDSAGKIVAITSSIDVTKGNIQSLIEGKKINLPIKNDWLFNRDKPLLVDDNGGNSDDFIYRSVFTKFKKGIGSSSGIRRDKNNDIIGMYVLNKPLWLYISDAYSDLLRGHASGIHIFEVKNTEKFKKTFDTAFAYCYDLTIPPTPQQLLNANKYLREDLMRSFNISVKKENRIIRSLVVTATDKIVKSYAKHSEGLNLETKSKKKIIHSYSIAESIKHLSAYFDKPLIDETGISLQKIDIDFPDNFNLSDRKGLISFLKELGLNIVENEREVEIIVISDK
jgi:thiol-disulfide isomerase/thioredoxin